MVVRVRKNARGYSGSGAFVGPLEPNRSVCWVLDPVVLGTVWLKDAHYAA